MTQDELNDDPVSIVDYAVSSARKVIGIGMEEPEETVEIQVSVKREYWDEAIASGTQAKVIIRWIESQRSS